MDLRITFNFVYGQIFKAKNTKILQQNTNVLKYIFLAKS